MTDAHTPAVLRHGPLTADMVPLLKAGSSVLVAVAGYWPYQNRGPFVFSRLDSDLVMLTEKPGESFFHGRFTYIGERDADGWITAPEGGWTENPVPGMRVDVRERSGRTGVVQSDDLVWANRSGTRPQREIIAFRLSDQPVPPEGVTASGDGWKGPGEKPHDYFPDLVAMGDCLICGHTYEAHRKPVENSPIPALGGTEAAPLDDPWAELERLAKAATRHLAGHDLKSDDYGRMIWGQSKKDGPAHVMDIRGWGYLTGRGTGALGLSYDDAIAAQKAVQAYAVAAWNAVPKLIEAARQGPAGYEPKANEPKPSDPTPVRGLEPNCQLCGGKIEGWICQTCEADFEEVDGRLVLKSEADADVSALQGEVERLRAALTKIAALDARPHAPSAPFDFARQALGEQQ